MRKQKIGRLKIELYDDIAEMPVVRFQRFNKMMLIDSGIGSDLSDFDTHIERMVRYMRTGENALAEVELQNLRQQVYFITENISPAYLAFAVLVKSINGKPCDDLSDTGLVAVQKRLQNESHGWLYKLLEAAKKKIDADLVTYFPGIFDDTSVKEYYDLLKRRTMLELDSIINQQPAPAEVDDIMGQLLTFARPQMFNGSEGAEVMYDRQFEDMCLSLTQSLNGQDVKSMTVLAYYNALLFVKKQRASKQGRGRPK